MKNYSRHEISNLKVLTLLLGRRLDQICTKQASQLNWCINVRFFSWACVVDETKTLVQDCTGVQFRLRCRPRFLTHEILNPPLLFLLIVFCFIQFFFFFSFRKQQGSSAYLIEVGGSSYMGMFGYLTAFEEMMNQVKQVV